MTATKSDLVALNGDLDAASNGKLRVLEHPGQGWVLVSCDSDSMLQLCTPRALRDVVHFCRGFLAGRSHAAR